MSAAAELAIDVRGVTKRFGPKTVVNGIDLQVESGEIFGFLGPNGSGKTTTIRIMCGLLTPDEGEGTVLGFDIRADSLKIKREVGYMTQRFSFYEDLTIAENLEFVARLYELKPVAKYVSLVITVAMSAHLNSPTSADAHRIRIGYSSLANFRMPSPI